MKVELLKRFENILVKVEMQQCFQKFLMQMRWKAIVCGKGLSLQEADIENDE